MDDLYKHLKEIQCLSITDYLKHEKVYTTHSEQLMNTPVIIIVTPELIVLLRRLCYKLGIIKSANHYADSLSSSSSSWSSSSDYTQSKINDHSQFNFSNLICQGYALLKQLCDQFSISNISEIKGTSIQLELFNIYTKFIQYEKELEPYYDMTCQRIQRTNNRLNVTDRLLGYRNNLNCVNPTKYTQAYETEFIKEKRPQIAPRFNIINYEEMKYDSVGQSNCEQKKNHVEWPSTIQERSGICLDYPGRSETRSAFTRPCHSVSEVLSNHGQLRACTQAIE
ncbi:unnamed protein product [Heterobilharzia americana]|nr:unnamed protein product [Heterobilharzia americana]